jgi:hypothetical protein
VFAPAQDVCENGTALHYTRGGLMRCYRGIGRDAPCAGDRNGKNGSEFPAPLTDITI